MTKSEEVEIIYSLGTTKRRGWQQSDNPCLAEDFGDLEKAWNTMTAKMDETARDGVIERIKLAVQAQAIFRRKERKAGEFVPQPKLIASWIRKKRWLNKIPSVSEGTETKSVSRCECGAQTFDRQYCPRCWGQKYTNEDKECFESLKKAGRGRRAGESQHDHRMRCKKELPQLLKHLLNKIVIRDEHVKAWKATRRG